jgi:hypothetical protein
MKANKQLGTYLNNHLTASITALELLSSLGKHEDPAIAGLATALHNEIGAEQQELQRLMEQLDVTKSMPRQAIGWLTEKFTQTKLQFDDADDGSLYLLEAFELLLIGIEGKRGLWDALAAAAVPGLPVSQYQEYAARSRDQQRRVEAMRIAAAQHAFTA